MFGPRSFRENYRKFVELNSDTDLDEFYRDPNPKAVLGDEDFCKLIDEHINSYCLSAEIVGADRIVIPPSIQEIIYAVSKYFDIDVESIYEINKQSGNSARQIAIFICRISGGYSLQKIANLIGNITYKGISKAIARVTENEAQLKIANKIMSELKRESRAMKY